MEPDERLSYCIARNGKGTLFLYGNKHASNLVIMCPGFPDDQYSFSPLARQLATECDGLVGIMCLPGYENKGVGDNNDSNSNDMDNGYSFAEWRGAMREAVRVLRKHSTNQAAKLFGVFHDWGCLLGLQYTNQCIAEESSHQPQASMMMMIPDKIVLLDVLMGPHPKTKMEYYSKNTGWLGSISGTSLVNKLYTAAAIATYQLTSAYCWWLHRFVSKLLAGACFAVAKQLAWALALAPASVADWTYLANMLQTTPSRIIAMSYPYYYLWKGILTGNARTVLRFTYLPLDLQRTPILYLYGTDKNFQLHDAYGFQCLKREAADQNGRCKVVEVSNAGHWLHHQQPNVCLEHIRDFLRQV